MSTSKITNYSINTDYINTLGGVNPKLVLMQERAKTLITLSSAKYTQELDYGASEFVKEDLTQNVILFGIAGKNGDSIQVTGTDSKRISWSGMFYSSNAIGEKKYLESILNAGNPMSFKAFYNKQVCTVIVQSASFEIRKSCYVTYSINLIEYNPIVYTAIKKDFWTQIPQNIGSNPGNPNLTEDQANLCLDSMRMHCPDESSYDSEVSITGGEINTCLTTVDVFSCNLTFMAKDFEERKNFIQAILNILCSYFLSYYEYGTYTVVSGVAVNIPNGLNCIMDTNNSSTLSNAFSKFLDSGCYHFYLLNQEVKLFDNNPLCVSEEFLAAFDRIKQGASPGQSFLYVLTVPKRLTKIGEQQMIEISPECAKYCMGEKAFNDLMDKNGVTVPNSGAEFTVELRYVNLPYAEVSVRQNIEGTHYIGLYYEATPGAGFSTTPNDSCNLWVNGDAHTFVIDMSAFVRNSMYNLKIEIINPAVGDVYREYDKVLCYKSEQD